MTSISITQGMVTEFVNNLSISSNSSMQCSTSGTPLQSIRDPHSFHLVTLTSQGFTILSWQVGKRGLVWRTA